MGKHEGEELIRAEVALLLDELHATQGQRGGWTRMGWAPARPLWALALPRPPSVSLSSFCFSHHPETLSFCCTIHPFVSSSLPIALSSPSPSHASPAPPGQPFDPSLLLAQATSNMMCSLVFGHRFPYDDKEFQGVVQAAGGVLMEISSPWGQVSESTLLPDLLLVTP